MIEKTNKERKDDFKMVRKFISELNPSEFHCAEMTMEFVKGLSLLKDRYHLTKDEILEIFNIKHKNYNNFMSGYYNYNLDDMVRLNMAVARLSAKEILEKKIIEIAE